jgi:RNA polymerase sigma-70 factor (ECF subfamily)
MGEEEKNKSVLITNPKDYEKLFKDNYSGLCRYANRYVKDMDSAEEVVQDMFVKLWEKREQIEIRGATLPYLMSAVRNSSLNWIKHKNIVSNYERDEQVKISIDSSQFEEEMADMEIESAIYNAMEKLPEQRKKVFQLSRIDGLKYQEIADKLGISIKTVEAQMGKALKQLRESLKDYLAIVLIAIITGISFFIK